MPRATFSQQIESARKRTEDDASAVDELARGRAERDGSFESDDVQVTHESTAESHPVDFLEDQEAQSEKVVKKAAEQKSGDSDGNVGLTVEERLDLMDQEIELRDLKLSRVESKASKWEQLAQRRAGELDFLRKSGGRTERAAETDIWSELSDAETDNTGRRRTSAELSEFEVDHLTAVRQDVQRQFLADHKSELFTGEEGAEELHPSFVAILGDVRTSYEDELSSNSPKRVRKAAESILKESRLMFKEQELEASIADARKRRAVVSQKARDRKLMNQASESSASPTSETDSERSIEDLSVAELAALLRKDPNRSL